MIKKKLLAKYFLIGGKGLIGKSIANLLKKKNFKIITKKNYKKYIGKECSVLINANGNSSRYYGNKFPKKDFKKSVLTTFDTIFDFKFKKYIFISSGDVYNRLGKDASEKKIILCPEGSYGKNKLLSELIIKLYCKKWLIVRAGPIIGPNQKKGLIFDLKNNRTVYSNKNSTYCYIGANNFAKILLKISKKNNKVFNISGNGTVKNSDIKKIINSTSLFDKNKKIENYFLNNSLIEKELKTKLPKSISEIKKTIFN